MNIAIRNLQDADIPKVITFCKKMNMEERPSIYWWFAHFFNETSFVALENKRLVGIGFGFLSQSHDEGYLHLLAVDPEHQNQGIGSNLIQYFEEAIKAKNAKKLVLHSYTDNQKAIEYYPKRGLRGPLEFIKCGKKRIKFEKDL